MTFRCFVILFTLLSASLFAQLDAGVDDTINPGVPVTLTANYGLIGNGVTISDDGVEGPFPIGFDFIFFGIQYSAFSIGANGWISFTHNTYWGGVNNAIFIPSSADGSPKNCILGPMQDYNPLMAGSPYIFYRMTGESPHRKLIVMWCQTPMRFCEQIAATFQIVLIEPDTIECHIFSKPECSDNDNKATLGIQNPAGTIGGVAIPGKNATSWTANRISYRFVPAASNSYNFDSIPFSLQPITPGEKISYNWYKGNELISENQSVLVIPEETTQYRAHATICNGEEFSDTVTVVVFPNIPNAFTPNGDGLNDDFLIKGVPPENITLFNMQIFNRWGQLVFSTNNISQAWDGKLMGAVCDEGVYSWVIYYEDNAKRKVSNKGTVLLLH